MAFESSKSPSICSFFILTERCFFSVSFSECVACCWWKRSNLLCFSDLLFVCAPSDTDTPRQLYYVFRYRPLKHPTYIQWTQQIPAIIGTHKSEGRLGFTGVFHEKPVVHIFSPLSFTHFTIENIPTHKMFFTLPSKRQQSWCTTVVPLCTYAFRNSWAAQYLT